MEIKKFWRLYPKTNRKNISANRLKLSKQKRLSLQKFGKEYFDGKRIHGYGGYYYNKKYFRKIAKSMIEHYKLNNKSKILDIGCAKGFLMHDFKFFLPRAEIKGLDISNYCKKNALESVKKNIIIGDCQKLPFSKNYFDFVVSISTIHNCNLSGIKKSLKEINRVSKKEAFIRVKAYTTLKHKKKIDDWNIVAKSNLSKKKWLSLFKKAKYTGDYNFSKF